MITYATRKRTFATFTSNSSDNPSLQDPPEPGSPPPLPTSNASNKALKPTTGNISKLPTPPTSDPLSPTPIVKHAIPPSSHSDDAPSSPPNLKPKPPPSLIRSTSAPTKLKSKPKPAAKMTQLTIDLGGPPNTRCKTCGMEYIPSSSEDRMLHTKYHAKSVGGVDIPAGLGKVLRLPRTSAGPQQLGREPNTWRIIKRLAPREFRRMRVEGRTVFERNCRRMDEFIKNGGVMDAIVEVGRGDSKAVRGFAKRVLERVERELGAVETTEGMLWGGSDGDDGLAGDGDGDGDGGRYKLYLYVRGAKCVGCILGQRITRAQKVAFSLRREGRAGAEALHPTGEYVDTSLGISRIWVSKEYHRSGIASELLDAAATYYFVGYGCQQQQQAGNVRRIPRHAMAFSQPTEAGLKLIEGYVRGEAVKYWKYENEGKDGNEVDNESLARTWLLYDEWEAQELREPKTQCKVRLPAEAEDTQAK